MKSKEEYWERILKEYKQNELSQEDFCREEGIPIAKFKYQWRKRIAGSQKADSQNKTDKLSSFEPILISSNKDLIRFI